MTETRTAAILQRVPVILKVTAASYGLSLEHADNGHRQARPHKASGHPAARRERAGRQR